jgi:hypothetical protein
LFASIREDLRADIPVIDVAVNINDQAFTDRAAETLLDLIHARASMTPHRLSIG